MTLNRLVYVFAFLFLTTSAFAKGENSPLPKNVDVDVAAPESKGLFNIKHVGLFAGVSVFNIYNQLDKATIEDRALISLNDGAVKDRTGWTFGMFVMFGDSVTIFNAPAIGLGFRKTKNYYRTSQHADGPGTPTDSTDDWLINEVNRTSTSYLLFFHAVKMLSLGLGWQEGFQEYIGSYADGTSFKKQKPYSYPFLHIALSTVRPTTGSGIFFSVTADVNGQRIMPGHSSYSGDTYTATMGFLF